MNKFLNNDITIRIISVAFAIILWFSANPIKPDTLTIPIKVENIDALTQKGIFLNDNYQRYATIDVLVRGDINVSPTDFYATLDFADIKSPDETQLSIKGPYYIGKGSKDDVRIVGGKEQPIKINLEKIVENSFKVDVTADLKTRENYKVTEVSVIPETISLTGPESLIESVDSVRVSVAANKIDKGIVLNQECKILDKQGKEVTGLQKSKFAVKVDVAKEVWLKPVIGGELNENYIFVSSKIKPEKVLVTGSSDILPKVYELETEAIDISNLTQSKDISTNIKLPAGVKLYDNSKTANVSVVIEPLATKRLKITKNDIKIVNTNSENIYNYEVTTQELSVLLRGDKLVLPSLNVSDLNPEIDVGAYAEGRHRIPISLDMPNAVKADAQYTVEVIIIKK